MSEITRELWDTFIPGITMPLECDYMLFYQVRDMIWHDESLHWSANHIIELKGLVQTIPGVKELIKLEIEGLQL